MWETEIEIIALTVHSQIMRANVLLMGLYIVLGQRCIRGTFPYATTFLPTEIISIFSAA